MFRFYLRGFVIGDVRVLIGGRSGFWIVYGYFSLV